MPKIKIDHVVSFSSEDPVHVANNILLTDPSKKWKCRTPGEISSNIVLQLEKACNITGIDIGNENSAYVEILVSRSSTNDVYKPLLVMSSFMTPSEARQSTGINKVRMFKLEELSDPERNEKWDRIKIVCTQPFNRHVQYGIAFINLHSSDTDESKRVSTASTIGRFTLRPDSPDNLTAGSLFARRKDILKDEPLKGAAAIREASSSKTLAEYGTPTSKTKIKIVPNGSKKKLVDKTEEEPKARNRNELLYSKDEEERNEKIDKLIERKAKETQEKELMESKEKQKKESKAKESTPKHDRKKEDSNRHSDKKRGPDGSAGTSAEKRKAKDDKPRSNDSDSKNNKRKNDSDDGSSKNIKKVKKTKNCKPFGKLLEGVTLVISGIQNPDRANLRTWALSLGAKYKPDWENGCTHLICAFQNTPKFNQVKGKGKIVTRKWIEECYKERKRLPWRRYALDKSDKQEDVSEEEIWEKTDDTPPSSPMKDNHPDTEDEIETIRHSNKKKRKVNSDTDDEVKQNSTTSANHSKYKASSDTEDEIERIQNSSKTTLKCDKSGSDTEDDIQVVESMSNGKVKNDVYVIDTDSDDMPTIRHNKNIPKKLKEFFDNKKFYVDSSFTKEKIYFLHRYIVAYKGVLVDDPTDEIDVIVTKSENVETLKEINNNAVCVSANWISQCHNSQKLVPMDEYILK